MVRASLRTRGKAKFCLRMVSWFPPGLSSFRPPLMNDQLDMWNILERAVKPKSNNKKKKKKNYTLSCFVLSYIFSHLPFFLFYFLFPSYIFFSQARLGLRRENVNCAENDISQQAFYVEEMLNRCRFKVGTLISRCFNNVCLQGFGCVDVGFWLFRRWILVVGTLDFGCGVVGFWLCGRWILVVGTLDFGCRDVGFWL